MSKFIFVFDTMDITTIPYKVKMQAIQILECSDSHLTVLKDRYGESGIELNPTRSKLRLLDLLR